MLKQHLTHCCFREPGGQDMIHQGCQRPAWVADYQLERFMACRTLWTCFTEQCISQHAQDHFSCKPVTQGPAGMQTSMHAPAGA